MYKLTSGIKRAISAPDVKHVFFETLAFENATAECDKVLRPLKVQIATTDE